MHPRPPRLGLVLCALLLALAVPGLSAGPALAAGPKTEKQAAAAPPSEKAAALRQAGDLMPYAPAPAVLAAYFTADEDAPKAVYGPVAAYVQSRACPASWLIEKGELARIEKLSAVKDAPPFEFSLTLEEDCQGRQGQHGRVTHSVFVAAPGRTPEAWLKWRSQFHGRKAEAHYGQTLANMRRAAEAGFAPVAELRFVSVDGELTMRNLDERLRAEGRLAPLFDLTTGQALAPKPGTAPGR